LGSSSALLTKYCEVMWGTHFPQFLHNLHQIYVSGYSHFLSFISIEIDSTPTDRRTRAEFIRQAPKLRDLRFFLQLKRKIERMWVEIEIPGRLETVFIAFCLHLSSLISNFNTTFCKNEINLRFTFNPFDSSFRIRIWEEETEDEELIMIYLHFWKLG